jgi:Fe-S-cluster-containing hydrogenase component 2
MIKAGGGVLGRPRIQVYETGPKQFMQMTCFQCVDPACATVCPSRALVRNEQTRAIEVDEALCVGCGLCEVACPFGHMAFMRDEGVPQKCDLCGGDPVCARFCPHQALEVR